MTPVHDELIELRGLRFHYRDWIPSKSDAPTLVLLHGYTGHSRYWDFFAQAMTDRYRVLVLDQRGHGETQWAARDAYGNEEMEADLKAFVGALGLQKFSLVGLSMGGIVSIRYASTQPAELDRLVIVDIGPEIMATGLTRIMSGAQSGDVFESREAAYEAARIANPNAPGLQLRHRVWHGMMRTQDGRWTYRYDRALRDPSNPRPRGSVEDNWRMVSRIQAPTLIVRGGESDILSVECAQRMVSDMPNARLVEVREAGHSVPLERPDSFLESVRGFL